MLTVNEEIIGVLFIEADIFACGKFVFILQEIAISTWL